MTTQDPYANFQRAIAHLDAIVAGIRPDQLSASTPCEGWDVRAALNHVVGGMLRFGATVRGETPPPAPGIAPGADPKAAYQQARDALLAAWRQPGVMERTYQTPIGELPAPGLLGILTTEYSIHAWDLARATGQEAKLDQDLAATALGMVQGRLGPETRGPGRPFAPEVQAAATAPAYDRLAAYMGRQP